MIVTPFKFFSSISSSAHATNLAVTDIVVDPIVADGSILAGSRRTVVEVNLAVGAREAVHACALVPVHLVLSTRCYWSIPLFQ
jgi:hypothetical protein